MNELLHLLLVFIAGLLLGGIFFGGLWLTVKKTVSARQPALLIAGSFFLRIAIVLLGFYFIAAGNWKSMLISLLGFISARFTIIMLTRPYGKPGLHSKKEVGHEA